MGMMLRKRMAGVDDSSNFRYVLARLDMNRPF